MSAATIFDPVPLARGPALKNRLMLAPVTNQESHADGRLSDTEIAWLTMRAAGGFALVMTAAAPVQLVGTGYTGQLGIFGDEHIDGLTHLARSLREQGALSAVQLYHGGERADRALIGTPVAPSDSERNGARALTLEEVEQLREDFISAALRAEKAGFDGVQIHGAHGYILAQFLSPTINRRDDRYGGSFENRSRLMLEVIDGIRRRCRPDFQVGLRLSPERFGMRLAEVRDLAVDIMQKGQIDYLDMSLWDVTKEPHEGAYQGRSLLSYFTDLPRGNVRLGAAGKIMDAATAASVIEAGCDFVTIGRAAILRHDFPERVRRDPAYVSPPQPVGVAHLRQEGTGDEFLGYLRTFPGLVADAEDDE
ncbi:MULTISPECIES: NADH:flavin oxidoreductase [Sphingobium]|uniref:NADH:flavin oxidoreductase n=1 Tax=Sphingobium TaxID=165695 RepID=UPI00159C09F3|nr:NADH:flavin oxidoreductase [Sphingobium sp. 15-1]